MDKRGQITIFIILALLIVSAILIFFLWIKPKTSTETGASVNFDSCVKDAIEKSTENLGKQGGFINPEFYHLYKGDKIGYLCYTNMYYRPCVNQVTFVVQNFEDELKKDTESEIQGCYQNSINELKNKGFDVASGQGKVNISLKINRIEVLFNAPTVVSRDNSQAFEEFNVNINSPIYNILTVSQSIISSEISLGDASIDTLMVYYPELIIDRNKDEDITIYKIQDKSTKTVFQFAIRNYVFPAGQGLGEPFLTGR